MPCNTIQTNTVELSNVKNDELLLKALADFQGRQLGAGHFTFRVNGVGVEIRNGEATSTLPTGQLGAVLDLVKQAYSRAAVTMAAKRFGWAIKKTGSDVNKFSIRKG